MTNEAIFSSAAVASVATGLGESIICPVCLNIFSGRIRQCSTGHSVCELCYSRLNECPTCRGSFAIAMRNSTLQEVIGRLHLNGLTANVLSDVLPNRPTNSIPVRPPLQPRGMYTCRAATDCTARLPICRMYNHLRQLHADTFISSNVDLRKAHTDTVVHRLGGPLPNCFNMRLTVSLRRSVRRAVHIRKAGLFFVCFDPIGGGEATAAANGGADDHNAPGSSVVHNDRPTHVAWVQAACPNSEARLFKFRCELQFGQPQQQTTTTAMFEDQVFCESWLAEDVLSNRYCLRARVPPNVSKATLRVSIGSNDGGGGRGQPQQRKTFTEVVTRDLPLCRGGRLSAAAAEAAAPRSVPVPIAGLDPADTVRRPARRRGSRARALAMAMYE